MKPTLLRPGQRVLVNGLSAPREMVFIRRDKWNRICVFQCEAFRGLDGPTDDGKCEMTDARVSRAVKAAPASATP